MSNSCNTRERRAAMTERDVARFYARLAQALRHCNTVTGALDAVARDRANRRWAGTVADLREAVAAGTPLSAALQAHPKCFSPLCVRAVQAAETQDRLADVFRVLADHMRLRRRVTQVRARGVLLLAGVAAAIVAGGAFLTLASLTVHVCGVNTPFSIAVPKVFEHYHRAFVALFWGAGLVLLAVLGLRLTERGSYLIECVRLTLPIVRSFRLTAAVAQFSHALGLTLRSGVPPRESLAVALDDIDSPVIRRQLECGLDRAPKDAGLAAALTAANQVCRVLPSSWLWTLSRSEASRTVDKALFALAEAREQELRRKVWATRAFVIAAVLPLFFGGYCAVLGGANLGLSLGGGGG